MKLCLYLPSVSRQQKITKHSFSFFKHNFSYILLFYCSFFSLYLLSLFLLLFSFDDMEGSIAIFIAISVISDFKLLREETFKKACILLKI